MAGAPSPVVIAGMIAAGPLGARCLAAIPAVLRAFFSTNEIITSLMLNYIVALVLEYLIFDSHSYLRDTSGFEASVFPQGKMLPDEATWPSWTVHSVLSATRLPRRDRSRRHRLGAVHTNALRVRGAGDR